MRIDRVLLLSVITSCMFASLPGRAQRCQNPGPIAPKPLTNGDGLRYPLAISPLSWSVMGGEIVPVQGSDGLIHVAYSLLITNSWRLPATILSLEALSEPGSELAPNQVVTVTGEDASGEVRPLSGAPPGAKREFVRSISAGQSAIAYFDLTFKSEREVPKAIAHRVRVKVPQPILGQDVMTVESAPVILSCQRPLRIAAPFVGRGWVDGNGCCRELGPHRLVMNSINGSINPTEAFAIDWVRVDPAGKAFHDDPKDPKNWFGYGSDILSVADGTVVEVLRDLQDVVPGKNPEGLTLAQIAGNHVIVDLGHDQYAEYDHLAPASVTVQVGDKVKRGQKLGLLGNTGNSDSPHLHFQLMSHPSTLDGYALPFVFDSMQLEGRIPLTLQQIDARAMSGKANTITGPAKTVKDAMPLSRDVVSFP